MTDFIPASSLTVIDDEPRIRDLDLAERLEFSHTPEVRRLIERNRTELEMHGGVCVTAPQTSKRGGRPGKAYYLNEGQALVICALSRTAKAAEIRKLVIDVFMDWRKGKTVHVKEYNRRPPLVRPATVNHDWRFDLLMGGKRGVWLVEAAVPLAVAKEMLASFEQLNRASNLAIE